MDEATVQKWLVRLPLRRAVDVTAMHYLYADGVFRCLDLDFTAADLSELDALVVDWFRHAPADAELQPSSEGLWRQFSDLHPAHTGEARIAWRRYHLPLDGPLPKHDRGPAPLSPRRGRCVEVVVLR